ncbi:hypothetical protein [Paludisphaera soli]|uniref:hypothetical protein n=1 Tax=Paludisphaera soli TaxID=2712865 RepID=UPI0013EB6921|nr:hypothetical protein [Paludisphaera soli]
MSGELFVYSAKPALTTFDLRRQAEWEGHELRLLDLVPARDVSSTAPPGLPLSDIICTTVLAWPSTDLERTRDVNQAFEAGDEDTIRGLLNYRRPLLIPHCTLSCFEQPSNDLTFEPGQEEEILAYAPRHRGRRARTHYRFSVSRYDSQETQLVREFLIDLIRGITGGVRSE